jgi:AraC-like DNA-binding protein
MDKSGVRDLSYYDIPEIDESGSEKIQYDNPDFRVFARKNHNLANEIFPGMVIHYHKDVELIYIRTGYASYRVNDKVIHLDSGDGIIVNPDQLHLLISEDVDYCLDCVIFDPELILGNKYIKEKYLPFLIGDAAPDCIVLKSGDATDKIMLEGIGQIVFMSYLENHEMEILSVLQKIYQLLYEKMRKTDSKRAISAPDLGSMRDMLDYINANYSGRITVADICARGHIGKNACIDLFKMYTHMSPIDYVRNVRLLNAINYLENSGMSITEIAYAVGFNSASYFTKSFRQFYGMTPGEYRKDKRC